MTHTTPDRTPALVSIRLITNDVARLVAFYEEVTGSPADWATPDFAELGTTTGTLAIGSTRTVALFGPGSARAADNHTAIIEFLVEDVDVEYTRLRSAVTDAGGTFVNEPTTMPWGNRSLLFRDPDGNLVNYFAPVTPEAMSKFAR
ncbi:VOC family protein [Modestobacter sp. VKM Ac-2985]|uniref:VOC family protein n=1 Tax=Modestobacter sp. VKM Ac-2985 TaxID=3004139 RepID=UPI0022AB4F5F|nr:VOC family protein [Modestobacter sp. VKM Ac-2985]MCZ2839635.1 VOC family protein [Modestobacter sp. VKM Ac-2985]